MVQRVKVLATRPDHLSLIPVIHMIEKMISLQTVL